MPGLPAVIGKPGGLGSSPQDVYRGVAALRDGSDVVIWDGNGYELCDGRFELTFPMNAQKSESHFTTVPAGDDGYF